MGKVAKTKKEVSVSKVVQVEVIETENWSNPEGFNPHPKQKMGQGPHQIVLHNDPMTAAHVVQQILQEVFGKDQMEANFLMQEAHYRGQSTCFKADYEGCLDLLHKIDQIKMKLISRGVPRIHIESLTFSIDGVSRELSAPMKLIS